MSKDLFPILIFPVQADLWVGYLVHDQDVQAAGKSPEQVRKTLQKNLSGQDRNLLLPEASDLKEANLRFIEVSVKPALYQSDGIQPYPYTIPLRVPVVYGPANSGGWGAYVPWISPLEYQGPNWEELEGYLARQIELELGDWRPDRLHQLLLMKEPLLENLHIKKKKKSKGKGIAPYAHTPFLDQTGTPEPEALKPLQAPFVWQREGEVNQLSAQLQRLKDPLVILGDSGVGKTRVLRQALKQAQPDKKEGRALPCWRIDPRRIVASSKYLGEWQAKCDQLVDELQQVRGMLWLNDLNETLNAGSSEPENSLGAYLMHFIKNGQVRLLAEATPEQWDRIQQRLPEFASLFRVFQLDGLSQKALRDLLDRYASFIRQNQNIQLTLPAREEAMRLLDRYMPYEQFPGKIMHFLETSIRQAQQEERQRVLPLHIIRQFVAQTGLPELFLRDDLHLDQSEITRFFQSRIIGQEEVVDRLSEVIKIFKVGLNNPYKPITSLVFAGPTGVGKTASAKAVADFFFGREGKDQAPLIRLDMSEFQHAGDIDRLIGSERDPGKGSLARQVRERPFSVILLDEIEKAARPVFDTLLNILDEGRLMDAFGRVAHFRNSIIIMTTNLGATHVRSIGYQNQPDHHSRYHAALRKHFRPEFINRIDDFVFFHPLRPEDLQRIAHKELLDLNQRDGLRLRRLTAHFQEELVAWVSELGFDEELGARPLQRTIEEKIVTPLSVWLVDHAGVQHADLDLGLDENRNLHIWQRAAEGAARSPD